MPRIVRIRPYRDGDQDARAPPRRRPGDVTVVGVGASLEPLHGIKDPLELRRRIGASFHQRR
jgi:hypothetical protein